MEECGKAGGPKASREKVGDGQGAKEVAASFLEEVTVFEDMYEGISATAMRAGCGVTRHGVEVIRVVGVESMSSDQLEACGLEVVRVGKKNTLGEGWEDWQGVVCEHRVEVVGVVLMQTWPVSLPF